MASLVMAGSTTMMGEMEKVLREIQEFLRYGVRANTGEHALTERCTPQREGCAGGDQTSKLVDRHSKVATVVSFLFLLRRGRCLAIGVVVLRGSCLCDLFLD